MIGDKLRGNLPEWIKPILRFFYYSAERNRRWREIGIKKIQNRNITQEYCPQSKKLIVFIVVGADRVTGKDKISGGAMSIVSLCQETKKLKKIHGAEVIMCTWREDLLFLKHATFENETKVFRYEQILDYFLNLEEILIHIPELLVEHILKTFNTTDYLFFKDLKKVHINVMNQNIRLMPDSSIIEKMSNIAHQVTITTAHQQYCTHAYREYFKVPIHKFSVWISPEQYRFTQWKDKRELLVVSPDEHVMKQQILQKLKETTNIEIRIIENLTYEEYKVLIADAKWSLTFGEGLDGYFIEPIFSGAISFAVFNDQFFTESFQDLKTVYPSHEMLFNNIVEDIQLLDNQTDFELYQKAEFKLCAQLYSYDHYRKNITTFYHHEYTFP